MKEIRIPDKSKFGSKAFLKEVEVGKWFKFDVLTIGVDMVGYGKVVEILENGNAVVDKYFELPSYRPYAGINWYDKLPFAINKVNA